MREIFNLSSEALFCLLSWSWTGETAYSANGAVRRPSPETEGVLCVDCKERVVPDGPSVAEGFDGSIHLIAL